MPPSGSLRGRRILVVEDDYFLATNLRDSLETVGVEVVGPVPSVGDALALIGATTHLDAAILDVNLRGEMVFPVADALAARRVPFLFATGYDQDVIPSRFAHTPYCVKPTTAESIARTLLG